MSRNAPRSESGSSALADFAGALLPLRARDLQGEIDDRLAKIPNALNEYGYDPYGMNPAWMQRTLLPAALLYRHYFRVETFDIQRVPAGACLVICNHAGQLPFDGAMLGMALRSRDGRVLDPAAAVGECGGRPLRSARGHARQLHPHARKR
jgi:hypothetical protein